MSLGGQRDDSLFAKATPDGGESTPPIGAESARLPSERPVAVTDSGAPESRPADDVDLD